VSPFAKRSVVRSFRKFRRLPTQHEVGDLYQKKHFFNMLEIFLIGKYEDEALAAKTNTLSISRRSQGEVKRLNRRSHRYSLNSFN